MLKRYRTLIFVVVIIAIASGIVALLTYRPAPVVITINPPGPTTTPQPIRVYITGAVVKPLTTYPLPAGSRVQDAIAAAGGAKPDADLVRINLAQVLHDGDQINVPSVVAANGTADSAIAVISTTPTTPAATTKSDAKPTVSGPIH